MRSIRHAPTGAALFACSFVFAPFHFDYFNGIRSKLLPNIAFSQREKLADAVTMKLDPVPFYCRTEVKTPTPIVNVWNV